MALPSMTSEAPLEYTFASIEKRRVRGRGDGAASRELVPVEGRTHVSGVEGLDAVFITRSAELNPRNQITAPNLKMDDAREFDLCDPFVLPEHPWLPLGRAVGHAPQYDPGHLQPGLTKAN
jgi:hypothetical protein